jgi:hypothetical protein
VGFSPPIWWGKPHPTEKKSFVDTCNFGELIIIYATSEAPAIIAAIDPTFNAKNHTRNPDRLTMAEYSMDESNEVFAIDDLGNRDLVIVRDGNQEVEIVNYNGWMSRMAVLYRLHNQREIDAT